MHVGQAKVTIQLDYNEIGTNALLDFMFNNSICKECEWFSLGVFGDLTAISKKIDKSINFVFADKKIQSAKILGASLSKLFASSNQKTKFTKQYFVLFDFEKDLFEKEENAFGIQNIKKDIVEKVQKAFIDESIKKHYIPFAMSSEQILKDFFNNEIEFVVLNSEKKETTDNILQNLNLDCDTKKIGKIFDEIKKEFANKILQIPNKFVPQKLEDFFVCDSYFSKNVIKNLIFNRVVNFNIFDKGNKHSCFCEYLEKENISKKETMENCLNNLAVTLFDKNNSKYYWLYFQNIIETYEKNKSSSIDDVYKKLDVACSENLINIDMITTKFYIAEIKENLK